MRNPIEGFYRVGLVWSEARPSPGLKTIVNHPCRYSHSKTRYVFNPSLMPVKELWALVFLDVITLQNPTVRRKSNFKVSSHLFNSEYLIFIRQMKPVVMCRHRILMLQLLVAESITVNHDIRQTFLKYLYYPSTYLTLWLPRIWSNLTINEQWTVYCNFVGPTTN